MEIQKNEVTKKIDSGQKSVNLIKGVGFFTFFSTASVDYKLSINYKYMKRKVYEKKNGFNMNKEEKIYCLVENLSELNKLKSSSRWKKITPERDTYQGEKYELYYLVNEAGKNIGYYKVIKLKKYGIGIVRIESEIIYYKRRV